MESGTTMFKPDGRYKDGPKKGQIKWVRNSMSPNALYRGKYLPSALDLVKKLAGKMRVSKHRSGAKSTHRHQSR